MKRKQSFRTLKPEKLTWPSKSETVECTDILGPQVTQQI